MKPCVKCGSTARYDAERGRGTGRCRACLKRRNAARLADPDFRAKAAVRGAIYRAQPGVSERKYRANLALLLRKKYGLSVEQFEAKVAEQHGKCASCGDALASKKAHVDHDHHTGQVRGILCQSCNLAEGYLLGSPLRAERLAAYLRKHAPRLRLAQ